MLWSIIVNEHILESNPIYDYLFTVEEVNRRPLAGMPFRDAYKSVGIEVNEGRFCYKGSPLSHTHIGSLGNLCNDRSPLPPTSRNPRLFHICTIGGPTVSSRGRSG